MYLINVFSKYSNMDSHPYNNYKENEKIARKGTI